MTKATARAGVALGKCRTTFPARARGGMNTRSREAGRGSTVRSASTLLEKVEYVEQKEDFYATVNEEQMLKNSTFPIKAEELLALAKEFLATNNGCDKPELLADDFTFAGPVVGPIGKEPFIKAFSGFQITEAFPDMKANAYNFHVDPFELNRVWFCTRAVGTHTGTLMGTIQPTNKKVYSPPQMSSVTFNEKGQATHLTAGYVLDRAVGNTEGLGGVFGILHAIGKSPFKFPEGRPWKPSWQYRFFMFLGNFMQKFSKFFSKDE